MTVMIRMRLILDSIAIGLIIACLAYWWLDNLYHELFGTALFALVVAHNVFNRRWFGAVTRRKMDAARVVNLVTIVCLASAMIIMLVTSILISRDVAPWLALDSAFAVREIHMFAAYWLLLILAIHVGTRWSFVMATVSAALGISKRSSLRTVLLRLLALGLVGWGVKSSFEMAFGSKLLLSYSLDMWDFNESTAAFFMNYASIVVMYGAITHYAVRWLGTPRAQSGARS